MGPWIHEAKTKMVQLVDSVRDQNPRAVVRVGFVGYRDYGDAERFVTVSFMNAQDTMEQIRTVDALGGDDQAEDVAHGLRHALHMDWMGSDVKIVFHIADAPAHGMAFHDVHVSDRFPRGDPDGLDPRDIVERMSFLDIDYTFVRIHARTDTMVEQFHNCYTHGGTFSMIDLVSQRATRPPSLRSGNDTGMSEELIRSVTRSIASYTTSQETQCCSQNPIPPSGCED
jgi:hypothetical protein